MHACMHVKLSSTIPHKNWAGSAWRCINFTIAVYMWFIQADYEQELQLQQASHKRELARSKEEVAQLLAMADASSIPIDEELVRRRYTKEIERIKVQ